MSASLYRALTLADISGRTILDGQDPKIMMGQSSLVEETTVMVGVPRIAAGFAALHQSAVLVDSKTFRESVTRGR